VWCRRLAVLLDVTALSPEPPPADSATGGRASHVLQRSWRHMRKGQRTEAPWRPPVRRISARLPAHLRGIDTAPKHKVSRGLATVKPSGGPTQRTATARRPFLLRVGTAESQPRLSQPPSGAVFFLLSGSSPAKGGALALFHRPKRAAKTARSPLRWRVSERTRRAAIRASNEEPR
jgi:hypothetical protein